MTDPGNTTPMPQQPGVPPVQPQPAPQPAPDAYGQQQPVDPYAAQPGGPQEPPAPRKKWPWVVAAIVVLAVALFAFWRISNAVTVPTLVGLSQEEATQVVESVGLRVGSVTEEETLEAEAGTVLAQNPAPQTRSSKGKAVDLTIAGVPIVEVPDVRGFSQEQAESQLADAGLELGDVTQIFDDSEPGLVLDQSPEPDTRVEAGTKVGLDVSKGPQAIDVPDVVGLKVSSAVSELEDAGFEVKQVKAASDSVAKDTVIKQSPQAGDQAEKGSTVTITVSTGPDDDGTPLPDENTDQGTTPTPDPTPDPKPDPQPDPDPDPQPDPKPDPTDKVEVPDVVGMGPFEALGTLTTAGLSIEIEFGPSSASLFSVTAQSPEAGKQVDRGTAVTVTLALPEFLFGGVGIEQLPAPAQ